LAVGIEVCIPVHRWLYACSPNEIETSSLHDLDRIVGRIIPIPGACVLPDIGHRGNNPVVLQKHEFLAVANFRNRMLDLGRIYSDKLGTHARTHCRINIFFRTTC
jgi:hypothetical protein